MQDADLQALLDEDFTQTFEQLVEAVNVAQSTSLHARGMI